jgi:hypothetical protein
MDLKEIECQCMDWIHLHIVVPSSEANSRSNNQEISGLL